MTKLTIKACFIFSLIVISNGVFAQTKIETETQEEPKKTQTQPIQSKKHNVYAGIGLGADYGGMGFKLEFLPIEHFGLFAGGGYNFYNFGWNLGGTLKLLPNKRVSPNLMFMYGYNGVTVVQGASQYDIVSYGVTVGANLDVNVGNRGAKLSFGLFVPFRSDKFNDNYDNIKNDPSIKMETELLPVLISIGFNFPLE